jgi:AcrR family transcriptional regulator
MIHTVQGEPKHRPRVEGAREAEILDATVAVLAELGYDRLTMDAVATAAKASKATLYRRWSTKGELVVDAVSRAKGCPQPQDVDTGSLRGDLLAVTCGDGGVTDEIPMSVVAGLITALQRDQDLKAAFQQRFLAPRVALIDAIFGRAIARGEVAPDADLELIGQIVPAMCVHYAYVLGAQPDAEFVGRLIDNLVLPAARGPRATGPVQGQGR